MQRPFLPTIRFVHVLAAVMVSLVALGSTARADTVAIPDGTQLIILRHADRTGEELNSKGLARAAALPNALKGYSITTIFSPGFKRNLDTAAPLAAATGLDVTRIPAAGAAARMMALSAGKTVVWVGNQGNLAQIWEDLGAPGVAPLNYGDLFFVTPGADGTPKVRREYWGP